MRTFCSAPTANQKRLQSATFATWGEVAGNCLLRKGEVTTRSMAMFQKVRNTRSCCLGRCAQNLSHSGRARETPSGNNGERPPVAQWLGFGVEESVTGLKLEFLTTAEPFKEVIIFGVSLGLLGFRRVKKDPSWKVLTFRDRLTDSGGFWSFTGPAELMMFFRYIHTDRHTNAALALYIDQHYYHRN